MNGRKIKEIIVSQELTQAYVARKIGTSPQNFNSALDSEDVRSGIVESVAKVLGKKVSWMYGEEDGGSMSQMMAGMVSIADYERKVEECVMLKRRVMELEQMLKDMEPERRPGKRKKINEKDD